MSRSHANHAKAHLPWGDDPVCRAVYHVKVNADDEVLTTGNGKFVWLVPIDNHAYYLASVQIYATTASSSGDVEVMIRKIPAASGDVDLLSTAATLDAGETSVGTPAVVDRVAAILAFRDMLAIDVDSAGTGTMGLGVILELGWGLQFT